MNLKKELMKIGIKAGLADQMLDFYSKVSSNFVLNEEVENTDSSIKNYSYNGEWKGEILFLPRSHLPIYIMAHAFKTRGYKPIMLNDLALNFPKSLGGYEDTHRKIKEYRERKLCSAYGVSQVRIENVINPHYDRIDTDEGNLLERNYKNIKISEFAKTRTRRFLKKFTLDFDDKFEREVMVRYLNTAKNLVDASNKLINERNIKAVLVWEPAYVKGVPGAVADKEGVPGYSIDSGYRDRTRLIGSYSNKSALPNYEDMDLIKSFIDKPLNSKQKSDTEKRLEGRIHGSEARFEHTKLAKTGYETDFEGEIFGLFTNLIWDASLSAEGKVFDSPFHWLGKTIEKFKEYDDKKLIIKTHPAEELRGTNQDVSEWIEQNYSPLTDNIELLKPDTNVDPYKLIEELDASIVYNSTVGLETACLGKKVIVVGETHYKDLGFTVDPECPQEYFDIIENLKEYEKKEIEKLAKRYFYFLFEMKHFEFPFIETVDMTTEKVHPIKHEDLKPGNRNFDIICEAIIDNRPVVKDPDEDGLLDIN